jgi:hypothetical protein
VPGVEPGVAQVAHDDLRHGQVIFDNENASVHEPSLRTPDRIRNRQALISALYRDISSVCHKFLARQRRNCARLPRIEFSIL